MEAYAILITMMFSFGLSALTMPWFISKMKTKGLVVRDYYKPGKKMMDRGMASFNLIKFSSDCSLWLSRDRDE